MNAVPTHRARGITLEMPSPGDTPASRRAYVQLHVDVCRLYGASLHRRVLQTGTRVAVVEEAAARVASVVGDGLTNAPYLAQSLSRLYTTGLLDLDSSSDYVPVKLLRGNVGKTSALVRRKPPTIAGALPL